VDVKKSFYDKNGSLYYVDKIDLAHLKAKFIAVKGSDIEIELQSVREHLYMILTIALASIIILAYFLTKMFLRPIRNYISKIDDFIKDTTHELNTPIAAITMTIETMDKSHLDPKLLRKIMRIDIAAKTISNLYQDLSFVALYGKSPNKNEIVDLEEFLYDRIDYFAPLAEVKNISFVTDLQNYKLTIDRNKLRILVDNLISNAIKYNSKNGHIKIELRDGFLAIEDEGAGIEPDKLRDIFARYARFNDSSGGFGLGLNIVKMICDEYDIKISVKSELGHGSRFELSWVVSD
jgi:two-component system OmpR family sensor kinase